MLNNFRCQVQEVGAAVYRPDSAHLLCIPDVSPIRIRAGIQFFGGEVRDDIRSQTNGWHFDPDGDQPDGQPANGAIADRGDAAQAGGMNGSSTPPQCGEPGPAKFASRWQAGFAGAVDHAVCDWKVRERS